MTRYARAGAKGTHQRVAKDSTSWNELKPPPPQRLRGSNEEETGRKRTQRSKQPKRERFNKNKLTYDKKEGPEPILSSPTSKNAAEDVSKSQPGQGSKSRSKNANIRGFGESKSVKIFGQFWVPLEDGKRLKKLLQKLKGEGLSRKEILEALKNERRKAEKTSKRQRDKICFQCRHFGHILSDCPNLRNAKATSGKDEPGENDLVYSDDALFCFKCGSTEHTSRKCRKQGEKFDFAKCFICSGSGHIARQCPQNTRGIYPSGGSCGECGSIAHLKKDCPDLVGPESTSLSAQNDDPDAVTLRMSDPFLSTEYEPILEKDSAETPTAADDDNIDTPTSSSAHGTRRYEKKFSRNANKKRKLDDNKIVEFDFASNQPKQKLLPQKKRKVVKF